MSRLKICNLAIDHIRGELISSFDENSLAAAKCRLHYPHAVDVMLAKSHPWSFKVRRVVLAEVDNDREFEWLYSYSLPSDMAKPLAIIPDFEASGLALPIPLPGDPYAETWTTNSAVQAPYIIEGGVLYTNAGGATLSYVIDNIEEAELDPLVVDALALELASRLAIPIKGDREMAADLVNRAEIAWQRAIAEDMNRQPETYPDYISDREKAREGY